MDATSRRALQHVTAHAPSRPAEEIEADFRPLLDRARFQPDVAPFVLVAPHGPAKPIIACGSSAKACAGAISHYRPAKTLEEQVQLRVELTPEPNFAACVPELPPLDKEGSVSATAEIIR